MRMLVVGTPGPLQGELFIPPSKYHAHRALMLAALARGQTTIRDRTDARHVVFTIQALRGLGVDVRANGAHWVVNGTGGFSPQHDEVSVGSSGTTLYFLLGLAALGDRPVRIVGQRYFRRRPIGPLLRALQRLGLHLEYEHQMLPVTVYPQPPRGGHVRIDGTLSQWVSGLLMVAPFATEKATEIEVVGELNERTYLELTVNMMRDFGLQVQVSEDWRHFTLPPNQTVLPRDDYLLPPDIGSAAFGLAACALHPSKVTFRSHVPIHGHPEAAVLRELQGVGVPMAFSDDGLSITVDHDGTPPVAGRLDCRDIPDMVPILSTLASRARGTTVLSHISHVRLKESDRVASMLQLRKMGARVDFDGTDMVFEGVRRLHAASLSSHNDHRVLMALAVAGSTTVNAGVTELSYPHAYRISYPEFAAHMNSIGIPVSTAGRVPESLGDPA
ncbi:MAG: 3-phosphoshikimate 1-carboxyvinyltransferase [Solirubrobacteraceae bacterium]